MAARRSDTARRAVVNEPARLAVLWPRDTRRHCAALFSSMIGSITASTITRTTPLIASQNRQWFYEAASPALSPRDAPPYEFISWIV